MHLVTTSWSTPTFDHEVEIGENLPKEQFEEKAIKGIKVLGERVLKNLPSQLEGYAKILPILQKVQHWGDDFATVVRLDYSTGKDVQFILPRLGKVSEINIEQSIPSADINSSSLCRLTRKIISMLGYLFSQIFLIIKKPLINARKRKEAELDSIIKQFMDIDRTTHEGSDKASVLRESFKNIRVKFPIKTADLEAKQILIRAFLDQSRMEFIKQSNEILKKSINQDLRLSLYSLRYCVANKILIDNPGSLYGRPVKEEAIKEIRLMKDSPLLVQFSERLSKKVELLKKDIEIYFQSLSLENTDLLSKKLSAKISNIIQQDEYNYLKGLNFSVLAALSPELYLNMQILDIFLDLVQDWLDPETRYRHCASLMKDLLEKVKVSPEYQGCENLIEILEHNCARLENLKNFNA